MDIRFLILCFITRQLVLSQVEKKKKSIKQVELSKILRY